jgi:hypothetical protein
VIDEMGFRVGHRRGSSSSEEMSPTLKEAVAMRTTGRDPLDGLAEQRTVVLSSYRRDGKRVGTPVELTPADT